MLPLRGEGVLHLLAYVFRHGLSVLATVVVFLRVNFLLAHQGPAPGILFGAYMLRPLNGPATANTMQDPLFFTILQVFGRDSNDLVCGWVNALGS